MNEVQQNEISTTDKFLFVSDVMALDLVNTEIMKRGKRQDLLDMPQDLTDWWKAALQHHTLAPVAENKDIIFNPELLASVKQLRSTLRKSFGSIIDQTEVNQADLQLLNQFLSLGHHSLLKVSGEGIGGFYQVGGNGNEQLLFQIAFSAYELLTRHDLNRLHKCRNERCILYFYDTTKSATRHWCSLGCMNRARSIQNYRREKENRT